MKKHFQKQGPIVQWLRRVLDVDKIAVRFCVGPLEFINYQSI